MYGGVWNPMLGLGHVGYCCGCYYYGYHYVVDDGRDGLYPGLALDPGSTGVESRLIRAAHRRRAQSAIEMRYLPLLNTWGRASIQY